MDLHDLLKTGDDSWSTTYLKKYCFVQYFQTFVAVILPTFKIFWCKQSGRHKLNIPESILHWTFFIHQDQQQNNRLISLKWKTSKLNFVALHQQVTTKKTFNFCWNVVLSAFANVWIYSLILLISGVQRGGERGDDSGHPKQGASKEWIKILHFVKML